MSSISVNRAYGIDLSNERITVVRAEKSKNGVIYTVLADSAPVTGEGIPPVVEEINQACAAGRSIKAVPCSSQDSFIRLVEAPFNSLKKASAVFPSMLDVQLPFPLEKCIYQFVKLHRADDEKARAVAVAIPEDRLQLQLDAYSALGIDPEYVEQEAVALWRFSEQGQTVSNVRPRVILYLDHSRTVVVVGNNGLPLSSYNTKNTWSSEAESSAAEKFVLRLKQQVAGALGVTDSTPPAFLVCGPLASDAPDRLREQFGADVNNWTVAEEAPTYLARALANGILVPGEWNANLRSGTREHANVAVLKKKFQTRSLAVIASASAVLIAVSFLSLGWVKNYHEELQQRLQKKAGEISGLSVVPRGQEVFIANQYVESEGETYGVFTDWLKPTAYPVFKRSLETSRDSKMTIETIAVRLSSLVVKGTCVDWNDADRLADPFREQKWKTEIERKDAGGDERVHFTLKAQK